MNRLRRLALFMLTFVFFIVSAPAVSSQEETAITIHYAHGVSSFEFYKLADYSETEGLTLAEPFAAYTESVELLGRFPQLNTDELRMLSTTLEALVRRDTHSPIHSDATDEDGTLTWSSPSLGVYLVLGQQTEDETYRYTPMPILISVPHIYNGTQQYQVTIEHNKVQKEPLSDDISCRVLKIWKDDDYENHRPDSITVQLLQNSTVYDTVTLSPDNNWRYQWERLPAEGIWTVVETTIPDGYTMVVERDTVGFIIENTYPDEPPPPPDIPPTGQLWWPVPLLLALGLSLIVFGVSTSEKRA